MNNNLSLYEIEYALARKFDIRQNIIVPNISWGLRIHECDLFIVNNNGYAIEIEIKRSKADLKNDFKKIHNHKDYYNRIKHFYYAIPYQLYESCKDLFPENAGIICIFKNSYGRIYCKIMKRAKVNKTCRKLTNEEILHVAKLGTMRIWSLKQKLINYTNKNKI